MGQISKTKKTVVETHSTRIYSTRYLAVTMEPAEAVNGSSSNTKYLQCRPW